MASKLRAEGLTWADVAEVFRHRYHVNARVAPRLARGWSQTRASQEWNKRWPREIKTAKNFSHWETWPLSGHEPSLRVLDRLAQIYECSVPDLLADLPSYRRTEEPDGPQPLEAMRGPFPALASVMDEAGTRITLGPGDVSGLVPLASRPTVQPVGGPADTSPPFIGYATDTDVEVVRTITRVLANAENTLGGRALMGANMRQLRWGAELITATTGTAAVRRDLFEAVGNLAGVVGFSAFDAGDHPSALQCFRFALWCADEGKSWSLRACTLADIARMHAELGDPDAALSAIEFAQVRIDRLSQTTRAMLSTMHARYCGLTGRPRDAQRRIAQADEWFSERDASADPPWVTYYDQAEHNGSIGRALLPLAVDDRTAVAAAERLASAVELQAPNYPRSRTFSRIRLAKLLATRGDPDEAAAVGTQALVDAEAIQSQRMNDELRSLLRALDQRAAAASTQELQDRISSHLTMQGRAYPEGSER